MRLFIGALILFVSHSMVAQDEDVDKYFDDGGYSEASNVVKLNLTSYILHEFSLGYERSIGDRFGMHLEIGVLQGFGIALNPYWSDKSSYKDDLTLSYRIDPKIYLFGSEAPRGVYFSTGYRNRRYELTPSIPFNYTKQVCRDFLFSSGAQYEVGDYLTMEGAIGLVVSRVFLTQSSGTVDRLNKVFSNLTIRLGYQF